MQGEPFTSQSWIQFDPSSRKISMFPMVFTEAAVSEIKSKLAYIDVLVTVLLRGLPNDASQQLVPFEITFEISN